MENIKEKKSTEKEQVIILSNRKNISVSGTNKILSLKSDLIQLDTTFGNLLITGTSLELIHLDNSSTKAEISGNISAIKFAETKSKESVFRKIFKWYSLQQINLKSLCFFYHLEFYGE